MDGHIVGSMISANSITGEQIQANSIKTANLELSAQQKIQNATDEETVKALIKADLDGFESTLSKEFITVENATTQIQQATEVAVKEATQNIIDNAVSESIGAVDGQLNDKLNQYTGNTLLPAIAEKAEEVLQNAEDYVVTKLESYATKQELSSSISQTREQIELSVSEKYTTKAESTTIITEAIDGITVGAINRVLGTGENKSFKFNGGANETWLPYKFSNDISDKEVYVSFNYTLTGTAQSGSQIEFAPSYLKKTNNQTVYRPKHIFFTSNRLQDVNITDTVSFTTKDFQDISPSSTSYIRFVGNGFTGTLSISEVQIKPGNSKTSWSPAPEDVNNDIVNAKNEAIISANNTLISTIANHYTKSETDSKISVAKNEINLGVSNTYETKTNVETKVASTLNSAKSYSDTKKTEAINAAATDATNKANNAKNEAITSANNTLNSTIANYYTKSQTDSQINVAKNAITSSVSSTYATKTDVTSSINGVNSSISNLQNRMNSAEQKITDTAITNVVKQNFYTKSETDKQITSKGYQTASQVQQTVDALQLKFTQSGGYNKVRRSKPNETSNLYGFATRSIDGTDLKHDKVYTLTVNGRTVSGAGGRCLVIFIYDNGWNFSKSISIAETVDTTKSISFTIPNTVNLNNLQVTSYHYPSGGDRTGSSKVNWYQLTEGSLELPWSPHPSEVYDGITTIDKDGVTVTSSNVNSKTKMSADGFQLIRTTDNKKMFYVNQDGSLEMSGNFTQYDTNGKISIKIANNSYGCYDWLWDGDFVGNFGAFESNRKNTSGANQRFIGISNIADYGNQLILGVRSSPNSTNFNSYIEIDNTSLMHRDYVTFTANTGFKTNAIFRNPSNNNETGRIFGATNEHFFVTCNHNNQLRLGYEKNGSYYPGMSIYRNDNTSAGCAIEYYADEVHHNNVVIDGFLSVKGQKNRLVATENFGDRLLNAYETAECYFGDINEAIIGEDGEVKVELDEVFLETVNTTEPYQVFLTKYGEGDCYVSERHEKYFVIKGTPNLSVGFEVKAKQRGYEKERLKMAVDTLKSHQATSCSPCSEDEVGYTIDCETTINRG